MRSSLARQQDPSENDSDQAFAAMLTAQTRSLAGYARRLTNGGVDADDLVQDALLRCWTARRSFQIGTNFNAWSAAVMRNSFLSGRRRARFQADLPDDAIDRLLGVSETQEWAVKIRDMHWALSELTPEHRDAVLLAGKGFTMDEAADRLSISPGAFKSRLLRGRLRLRSLTEDRNTPLLSVKRKTNADLIVRRPKYSDRKGLVIG